MILKTVDKVTRAQLWAYYQYGDYEGRLINEAFASYYEFEMVCKVNKILFRVDIDLDQPDQMELFKMEHKRVVRTWVD